MRVPAFGFLLLSALVAPASAHAETLLERGAYLANSVAACGNCHTPIDEQGRPIPGQEFAGRFLIEMPEFTVHTPNITPDMETGIGGWSEAEIATAIREGRRPDGSLIGPPMPFELYRQLSDRDVAAIAAYVRSRPAVRNAMPRTVYRIPLPASYGPPVGTVPDVDPNDLVAYGAYLAGPVGHCIECHTPMVEGRFDYENQRGAGGNEFEGPWGVSVSANLTSHDADGIKRYSDAEVIQMITTGMRPDGTAMLPPMGFPYYARIKPEDLKAIVAYLRSLPPKTNPE